MATPTRIGQLHDPESKARWFRARTIAGGDCLLWTTSLDRDGYGSTKVKCSDGRKSRMHASRLAYILVHGHIPEGALIRHTCDNPLCVRPSHLLPGTPLDNARDRVARNRTRVRHGNTHPCAKLNEDIVLQARERHIRGEGVMSIARSLGVCHGTIRPALLGLTWKHVPSPGALGLGGP